MNSAQFRGRTIPGIPVVIPISSAAARMDKAIMRVEHYLKSDLDGESTVACIRSVARSSGYSLEELGEKMRIDFASLLNSP